MTESRAGLHPGMLDLARVAVLLFALVKAVRQRFFLGVVSAALAAIGMTLLAVAACSALSRHDVNGEYAFAFVYVGPTMLPLGERSWQPVVVQLVLAVVTAVPAVAVLRSPSSPVTNPFLLVFVPNAMLAVLTCFSAFLMWRQERILSGYYDNPSLVGHSLDRGYAPLALRPRSEEGTIASVASQTPVTLVVRNYSDEEIHLMWIDTEGHRDPRPDALERWRKDGAAPGITIEKATFAGQAFVITDNEGETMCTLVLGTEDAVADVSGPCR
jgi:hypothetical protein